MDISSILGTMKFFSAAAPVPGQTAIFYSGIGANGAPNYVNAEAVEAATPGAFYTLGDTGLGYYLNTTVNVPDLVDTGAITPDQATAIWNAASLMLAQQASGNVCALIGPGVSGGIWYNTELPALLDNGTMFSINDVTTSYLMYFPHIK